MKKLILALALLTSTVAYPQSPAPTTVEGWAANLEKFGKSLPQEEVFVHMDNSCYYLGDTLYYKVYARISDGRPSAVSGLMYVELLNQDGYLVERQKVEMRRGQGRGSFCLPTSLYAGYYELRAYTRWQLNWGEVQHPHTKSAEVWFYNKAMAKDYYRDYEKLYSRVFPVYNRPKKAGEYEPFMNLRPKRRYSKLPDPDNRATVKFYPEGGALVADAECRVAYEACNGEGEHLKGTLRVTDKSGQVVAETEVKHRGRGDFRLPVKSGEKYKAEFTWSDGKKAKFDLPAVETDGVAVQTTSSAEGLRLKLAAAGVAASEELGLTVSCHGVQQHFQTLVPGTTDVVVPMDKLQTGVSQVTVFNAQGRIYSDRLVFVHKDDVKASNLTFSGVRSSEYAPYAPIDLTVQGEPGSTLSLAVRDHGNSERTFDSGSMLTEMLLCSQLRGFVESPDWYFQSGDEFHHYALDLLLLVQGWRRYSWHTMATPGAFTLNHMPEKTETLVGQVNKYTAERRQNVFDQFAAQGLQDAGMDVDAEARAAEAEHRATSPSLSLAMSEEEQAAEAELRGEKEGQTPMQEVSEQVTSDGDVMVVGQNTTRMTAEYADSRFYENEGKLKREVRVHAEFTQPYAQQNKAVEGDVETQDGRFRIDTPHFNYLCIFNLAASDTTKWKKGKPHIWVAMGEDKNGEVEWPEYYVKVDWHYPRFVKPYDFYQQNQPYTDYMSNLSDDVISNSIVMKQVLVGSNKGGLRSFDRRYPAFTMDAYDAFNATVDAGLCPGYFIGSSRFAADIARTFVGDMNMERAYELEIRLDMRNATSSISGADSDSYNLLTRLDSVAVYTDYAPRLEGDPRYAQGNQPFVVVDLRRIKNSGSQYTWRDRRLRLTGFAVCEDFYQPDYSNRALDQQPTDYRRTLYWNPDLQLDSEGRATVRCWNNGQRTRLAVSAEGMSPTGAPQSGMLYPNEK